MTRPPTVSIVINNYNYGPYVGGAIDSALRQTYPAIEVVVVDDGSTDDSRQVIESRGDRIRAIFKVNGGQSSAINVGFKASTGDLVLFLDSDDLLEPTAIETVASEWRDDTVRILFPLDTMDKNGRPLGRHVGGAAFPSHLLGAFGPGSPTSGNVFSRTALEKVMPIPEKDFRSSPDYYLAGTTSIFGTVKCLRQPLAKYRMHEDSDHFRADPVFVVRNRVYLDLKMYETLFRLTEGKIKPLENWLGTCPQHWVRRITSLREKPGDHPWPDSLPHLTARAVKATWRQPNRNFRRKLSYTLFIIGYAILPGRATRLMGEIERGERRLAFRRLLGGRNPVGAGNY